MKRKHLLVLGGAAVGGWLLYRSARGSGLGGLGLLQADASEEDLTTALGALKRQRALLVTRAQALPINAAQQHLDILNMMPIELFKQAAQYMMINDAQNSIRTLNEAERIINDESLKIGADEQAVKAKQTVAIPDTALTFIKRGAGAEVINEQQYAAEMARQKANEPAMLAAQKGAAAFAVQKATSAVTGTVGDVLGTFFKTVPAWLYVVAVGGAALYFFGPQLMLKARKYRKAAAPLPEPAMQANPRRRRSRR